MQLTLNKRTSKTAAIAFDLLNPIPFGFFVAALIFDVVYDRSADVLWFKSAAWLIAIGLCFAVVPRFINLARVWWPNDQRRSAPEIVAFFLYLLGVAAAIVNAFVHSRDAYGVMPEGVWLSVVTVTLLVVSTILMTLQHSANHARSQA
ncbi:hypothetical protein BH11PSE13_BH11PSE13_40320 [soil metagenome]